MDKTPVRLLEEQIIVYQSLTALLDIKLVNGFINKNAHSNIICDVNKKIYEFKDAIKILNEATESEDKVCNTCKHNTPNNALCYQCVHAPGWDNYANVDER